MHNYLQIAIAAALKAGEEIMEVYKDAIDVEYKEDRSPLTAADKRAHAVIFQRLTETHLPILSEEGKSIAFEVRKNWERFWLVDPLDGTKEFIKRNGEFTVNIALIDTHNPVAGVIYVPATGSLYFGSTDTGSFKVLQAHQHVTSDMSDASLYDSLKAVAIPLPNIRPGRPFTVIASRSHLSDDTASFIDTLKKQHGELTFISKGSSLKICLVAEGEADVYPRLAPTMEWDTAAGHAIARGAGCKVSVWPQGNELLYNKENLLNPFFVVAGK